MFRVTLGASGFFSLLFAAKIERQSRDHHDRCFAAQCSPQTTRKKPSCTQGTLGSEAPTQKIQKCTKARTLPWSARDFSSAVSGFCQVKASPLVASAYGRRCVDFRPTPKIPENSRRTREKPLVPRVRERLLFAQTKGGKMLHVAYRD